MPNPHQFSILTMGLFYYLVRLVEGLETFDYHVYEFKQDRKVDNKGVTHPNKAFSCGQTVSNQNHFNFHNQNFPKAESGPATCTLVVELDPLTCAVSFDFDTFKMADSVDGYCALDRFIILPINYTMTPLCGDKSNYSGIVSVRDIGKSLLKLHIVGQSQAYSWNISVTQLQQCGEQSNLLSLRNECSWVDSVDSQYVNNDPGYHNRPHSASPMSYRWKLQNVLIRAQSNDKNNLRPTFHIIGGQDAYPHEFPWIAALLSKDKHEFLCGGSLISRKFVLTAAHCFISKRSRPSNILVELGAHDRSRPNSSFKYNIRKVISHFGFLHSPSNIKNDIALVMLSRPVERFTSQIHPICLSSYGDIELEGEEIVVAGWGTTSTGNVAKTLQKTSLIVHPKSDCRKGWGQFGTIVDDKTLCLETFYLPTLCNGDSGSPVMWYNNNHFELIGIVSFGKISCFHPALQLADVATRVNSYKHWIFTNILRQ